MADSDPFAAAGFVPAGQVTQPTQAVDPFAAAGFTPASAPAPTVSALPAPSGGWAGLSQALSTGMQAQAAGETENNPRVAEKVAEGATFGMFPYIAAAGRYAMGTPWDKALSEARGYTAETSAQHPVISALAEAGGSLIPVTGAISAARPAVTAISKIPYVGSALAQSLLGAGLGGASTAGQDIGGGQTANLGTDMAKGAGVGAALGGASVPVATLGQTVPNIVGGGVSAIRNMFSSAGRDAMAGQVLREAGGDFADQAARSPVPGLDLRTAQTTGNPGLAELERTIAPKAPTAENTVQSGRTPAQMGTLARSLIGNSDAQVEPAVLTNQASAAGTQAIQGAREVLRKAEGDLWNAPELSEAALHPEPFIQAVRGDVARMPPSFQMSINKGPLNGLMADVEGLPEKASLADINAIRSRVLEQARSSRASGDAVSAAAAQQFADSILDRTGAALGDAGAPIMEAYQVARDFTRQRAQTLGYPEFDAILRPNAAGNMRANDETAFGRFFDLSGGSDAGLQRLQGLHDLLRATGQPEANAAADQLQSATQQYVRAGIMRQARAGAGLDVASMPVTNPATLATTINRTMPAISGTPMTAPIAGEVQGVGNAAELLNRPSASRGDLNSTTFEKLQKRDLLSAVLGQGGSPALGALAGGLVAGRYGEDVPGVSALPWYLRVPAGAAMGAVAGRSMAPFISRSVAHVPFASAAISGPTGDIMRRVAAGLESPAEYQRLLASRVSPGPTIFQPGAISAGLPPAVQAAIPLVSQGGR